MAQEKNCLNIKEMGEYLNIGLTKANELARQKGFPAYRLDKKTIRIPIDELKEWIKTKRGI